MPLTVTATTHVCYSHHTHLKHVSSIVHGTVQPSACPPNIILYTTVICLPLMGGFAVSCGYDQVQQQGNRMCRGGTPAHHSPPLRGAHHHRFTTTTMEGGTPSPPSDIVQFAVLRRPDGASYLEGLAMISTFWWVLLYPCHESWQPTLGSGPPLGRSSLRSSCYSKYFLVP